MSPELLQLHFEEQGFFIRAANNVEITLQESGEVFVTLPIESAASRNIHIDLMADFDDLQQFIDLAGITSLEDLDKIKNSVCWKRYQKGKGYVACSLQYFNHTEVCFRVCRDETMVYSLDLHYYDEVDKILSLPEQFVKYIQRHWREKGFVELEITDDEE